MNSHELQQKIKTGDRDAFRTLYGVCGPIVYQRAHDALGDDEATRSVVKQVFLNLHHEIQVSPEPLDIDVRLAELTQDELCTARLLAGDFSAAQTAHAQSEARPAVQQDAPADNPAPAAKQPPLQRAEAYMDAENEKKARRRDSAPEGEPPRRSSAVITVLIILFLLMFLWVLAGILMDFSILPRINLGYQWFNSTVFPLFNL